MDEQKTLDEARRIIDGDDVPLWAVAAALQLGYAGDGAVLHVAEVMLRWHDLYGNDQELALAEAGAKAMRDYLVIREKQDGPLSAYEIEESDPAAIARRAVDGEQLR